METNVNYSHATKYLLNDTSNEIRSLTLKQQLAVIKLLKTYPKALREDAKIRNKRFKFILKARKKYT